MGARITSEIRSQVLAGLEAGKRNGQIARELGISTSSVGNIARENGFPRAEQIGKVTLDVLRANQQVQRARISQQFLDASERLIGESQQENVKVWSFGGKDNTYNEHVVNRRPPFDQKTLLTAAAICLDKHLVIARHDNPDDGASKAASLLTSVLEQLGSHHSGQGESQDE